MINEVSAKKIRSDFPALTQRVNGKPLIYLDSAASALKPWPVIERIGQFYTYEATNVHRGTHYLSQNATNAFEETRESVRNFINAKSTSEIIFTKGATESLNLVAQSYARTFLKKGDEILLSELEHHANLVPWQMVSQQVGCTLKFIPVTESGQLDLEQAQKLITEKTKLVSVSHCSNMLGSITDIKSLSHMAHNVGAIIVVDGAQAVANFKVDVQNLNVDFYAFSGHKIFGPYGVGVLYGKKELLEKMPPYQGGGSMISEVTLESSTYNDIPFKFEAGTPAVSSVIALKPALDYMAKIPWEFIENHERSLIQKTMNALSDISGVRMIGAETHRAPLICFEVKGCHHSDIAQILDQEAIAVRSGHHCTQPLLKRFNTAGTVRASFSIYNNEQDVDIFIKALLKAKEMLS